MCPRSVRCRSPSVARRVASRSNCQPGASFLGGRNKTVPPLAAFCNGILFRYLDYNDTYLSLEPAHPSDNFAAVLAAAEAAGAGGKEVITAAVLGYEIQCRLCDAASIRKHGWDHVTYGAFSTAAAAGKLLKLNAEQITQALEPCRYSERHTPSDSSGRTLGVERVRFANASRNGVFAAMLAAEGLTGPSPIFEGEMGFFKQVSGPFTLPNSVARPAATTL